MYVVFVVSFPMVTITSRLLEERDSRVQEALLMTGLNEVVWYTTWLLTIIIRSILVGLIAAIMLSIWVFQNTGFAVLLICMLMYKLPSIFDIVFPSILLLSR